MCQRSWKKLEINYRTISPATSESVYYGFPDEKLFSIKKTFLINNIIYEIGNSVLGYIRMLTPYMFSFPSETMFLTNK